MFWLLSLAFAAPKIPEIRLAPEAVDVEKHYQEQTGKKLACQDYIGKMKMCFRYLQKGKLPYVDKKLLKKWKISQLSLLTLAEKNAKLQVTSKRYRFQEIAEIQGGYWISDKKDGWDAAGFLHPKRLTRLLQRKPLVAMPQAGTFLFWEAGNPMLDKVMAVGVREIYDNSEHPISSAIYHYDGAKWMIWGEAVTVPEKK